MRLDLQTHPKIVRILSATKSDKFRVVGGLHAVWSVFDTHSSDGKLDGYTPETLDHVIGWPGFSDAMIRAGWLMENDDVSLSLPEFDEHNGTSGKRRAEDQKRKRNDRKDPQPVRKVSANEPDKKLTREEKRREENNKPEIASFDEFWKSYPKKVGKGDAEKAWAKVKPDADLQDKILKAVAVAARSPDWLKESGQFIPHASTWLNGKRWEDGIVLRAVTDAVPQNIGVTNPAWAHIPKFRGVK